MKVKIKTPFEIEITTKQQLELHIIEVFNWCLEVWYDWLIELDEDNYISVTNDWNNNKMLYASLALSDYESWYLTLDKLLKKVMKDKFILDNFN